MTFFTFIERIIIPALLVFVLIGAVGGLLLGGALVFRSATALRFIARMNLWVSTRRALRLFEIPRSLEAPPGMAHKSWLGVFLVIGGALAFYFLLARLDLTRTSYVPGVDLRRWFLSGLALNVMKWFLVAGSVLALAIGALILFSPQTLAALEARMNHWYSTRKLISPGGESMRAPLDSVVEAYPRASGWIIAAGSLLVAISMVMLLAIR